MNDRVELNVFLAHSNEDKPWVREIYYLLALDGFSPWLDQESLLPGQEWEAEVRRAMARSHAVVLFVSESGIGRSGYLHKELKLAVDLANEQPEGSIAVIPIRVGEPEMPSRLEHLHWLESPSSWDDVAGIYSRLQSALIERAIQLGKVDEGVAGGAYKPEFWGTKGMAALPVQDGQYLIRGVNPDGSKYYGMTTVRIDGDRVEMTASIGGRESVYKGKFNYADALADYQSISPVVLLGEHEVVYARQSWTGVYDGRWGVGGREQLIPTSPLAQDIALP